MAPLLYRFFRRPPRFLSPLGRQRRGSNPGRWHRKPIVAKAQPLEQNRSRVMWWVWLTCFDSTWWRQYFVTTSVTLRFSRTVATATTTFFHEPSRQSRRQFLNVTTYPRCRKILNFFSERPQSWKPRKGKDANTNNSRKETISIKRLEARSRTFCICSRHMHFDFCLKLPWHVYLQVTWHELDHTLTNFTRVTAKCEEPGQATHITSISRAPNK